MTDKKIISLLKKKNIPESKKYELLDEYFASKYSLSLLFSKYFLDNLIFDYFKYTRCGNKLDRYSLKDFEVFLEHNKLKVLLIYLERAEINRVFIIISRLGEYNKDILSRLTLDQLHSLYKIYGDTLMQKIIESKITNGSINKCVEFYKKTQGNIISFIKDSLLLKFYNELDTGDFISIVNEEDLKWYKKKVVVEKDVKKAFKLIEKNCTNLEEKQIYIDIILNNDSGKYLYLLLISDVLNKNEIKIAEKNLEQALDIQYKYYYLVRKNKERILYFFGTYSAFLFFMKNNYGIFSNDKVRLSTEKLLKKEVHEENKNFQKFDSNITFVDDSINNLVKSIAN